MTDHPISAEQDNALLQLARIIEGWSHELGFQQIGISDLNLSLHAERYKHWLEQGMHADMQYMLEQKPLRLNPESLLPGTVRVISARMDYLPAGVETVKQLDHPEKAYISRYALGRDYHKLIRKRLAKLGKRIEEYSNDHTELLSTTYNQRPFVDSAPILERAFAEKSGLGWIGKNTMLINSSAGSWFFLGELLTNIPLPTSEPQRQQHCGSCTACLDICPTKAFDKAFVLDARKCISYLTIENKGVIPVEYRKAMGNRIFGCDDCQIICPWNKFSQPTQETDFTPRHGLADADLIALFLWSEEAFLKNTEGSAIRRAGYENWLRNIATALGNAKTSLEIISALQSRLSYSDKVDEHILWALQQHKPHK